MKANKVHSRSWLIVPAFIALAAAVSAADTTERQRQRQIEARIRKNTVDSFVVIHYHFKKSERPQPPDDDYGQTYYDSDEQQVMRRVLAKPCQRLFVRHISA